MHVPALARRLSNKRETLYTCFLFGGSSGHQDMRQLLIRKNGLQYSVQTWQVDPRSYRSHLSLFNGSKLYILHTPRLLHVYNLITNTLHQQHVAELDFLPEGHCTACSDTHAYIFGSPNESFCKLYELNLATFAVTIHATPYFNITNASAAIVHSKLYIFGGNAASITPATTFYAFDTVTKQWESKTVSSLDIDSIIHHSMCAISNRDIIITGGSFEYMNACSTFYSFHPYNETPFNDTYHHVHSENFLPRAGAAIAYLGQGVLLCIGGTTNTTNDLMLCETPFFGCDLLLDFPDVYDGMVHVLHCKQYSDLQITCYS